MKIEKNDDGTFEVKQKHVWPTIFEDGDNISCSFDDGDILEMIQYGCELEAQVAEKERQRLEYIKMFCKCDEENDELREEICEKDRVIEVLARELNKPTTLAGTLNSQTQWIEWAQAKAKEGE